MRIREKLLLLFYRSKVVRIRIYQNDHRISDKIAIPKDGLVSTGRGTYTITKVNYFFEGKKAIPTYTYVENETSPIDPIKMLEGKAEPAISAKEIKALVERKDIKDVMLSAEGRSEMQIILFALLGFAVLLGIGGYFLYAEITAQSELLRQILGGGQ